MTAPDLRYSECFQGFCFLRRSLLLFMFLLPKPARRLSTTATMRNMQCFIFALVMDAVSCHPIDRPCCPGCE